MRKMLQSIEAGGREPLPECSWIHKAAGHFLHERSGARQVRGKSDIGPIRSRCQVMDVLLGVPVEAMKVESADMRVEVVENVAPIPAAPVAGAAARPADDQQEEAAAPAGCSPAERE